MRKFIDVDGACPLKCTCGIRQRTGPTGVFLNALVDSLTVCFCFCDVLIIVADVGTRLKTRLSPLAYATTLRREDVIICYLSVSCLFDRLDEFARISLIFSYDCFKKIIPRHLNFLIE